MPPVSIEAKVKTRVEAGMQMMCPLWEDKGSSKCLSTPTKLLNPPYDYL